MNSDTPRTDQIKSNLWSASQPEIITALLKHSRQLELELNAANAKLLKLYRMVEIAEQANDTQTEQQVALSASFQEALAYTRAEMLESQVKTLKEVVEFYATCSYYTESANVFDFGNKARLALEKCK